MPELILGTAAEHVEPTLTPRGDRRCGVQLATDLYFPARNGRRVDGTWPVIMERTPYNKLGNGLVAAAKFFARHGYAVVLQDVRGRFASQGESAFADKLLSAMRYAFGGHVEKPKTGV